MAACPAVEMIRFVSSGTEAVMSAVRLARGFTGRDRIVKFTGCYHGHADPLLVEAGSGLATFGIASSAGVPAGAVADTLVLPLDDEQAVSDLFAREGDRIAAVLIEPVPANCGLLLQRPEYLRHLRGRDRAARRAADLRRGDQRLPRSAWGEPRRTTAIRPDLATYGKIIGGGLPVGAFGGRREIMDEARAAGAGVPGRHAVGQSGGDGGRRGHAARPRRGAGARAAGGAGRAAGSGRGAGRRRRRGDLHAARFDLLAGGADRGAGRVRRGRRRGDPSLRAAARAAAGRGGLSRAVRAGRWRS